ncbi:MAG: hypothetical protein GQ532_01500 [Methylomarinum sp.]|nr:hypothetical protein [Methylomarinum sp.]
MSTAFKCFRIITLLMIFVGLAFYSKTQKLKSRSWSSPLEIIIYPMNSEDSPIVEDYITQLDSTSFEDIDQFFKDEAEHYELSITQPTATQLGKIIQTFPPEPPATPANFLELAWWSIKFRYWAYQATPDELSNLHRVRIFVHYHQQTEGKLLQHSLGLNKGLLSIVHAFASKDQEQQNNIVIAHEFLHTVGATDKYNANNQAVFPDGYADPEQQPLFPQLKAEIMSGRIPLSSNLSKMAASLDHCIIGNKTANEINWISYIN